MESFAPLMPYQCVYSTPASLFLGQPSFMFPSTDFSQNYLLSQSPNLETSFTQLSVKYNELLLENEELKRRLENASGSSQNSSQNQVQKRKIKRRKEEELDKKYACCYENCKKEYASVLALNLHIKTRHQGGTRKQRDNLAKQIIIAELRGEQIPSSTIALPRDYVQKYRTEHFSTLERLH